MSKLAAYYDGKVIFTTGLTGSMGIVWAHKILTCTNVKRVYGLVRAPPGEEQKRLHETWRTFVPLSAQRMIDDGRVIAINGDITRGPLLGMDEAMAQRLREEAHIVMSIGAEINLGKKAKDLAATNIFGGLAVAALAASCPKLERFVSVLAPQGETLG
jgi:thioester reductase-like protein